MAYLKMIFQNLLENTGGNQRKLVKNVSNSVKNGNWYHPRTYLQRYHFTNVVGIDHGVNVWSKEMRILKENVHKRIRLIRIILRQYFK
jgi:hypothetical protein